MTEITDTVKAAMTEIRALRQESIAFRRGDETLAAQNVRIERVRGGRIFESDRGSERRADVVINAAVDADIEVEDRFNDGSGTLYRVSFIRPNRSVATFAEAVAVE